MFGARGAPSLTFIKELQEDGRPVVWPDEAGGRVPCAGGCMGRDASVVTGQAIMPRKVGNEGLATERKAIPDQS